MWERLVAGGGTSFDWSEYLNKTGSEAATVARFKHVSITRWIIAHNTCCVDMLHDYSKSNRG